MRHSKSFFIFTIFVLFLSTVLLAGGSHDTGGSVQFMSEGLEQASGETSANLNFSVQSLLEDFKKFPTLHPLVVHFPIVLLLMAFPIYLFGFFGKKQDVKLVALFLFFIGTVGAVVASYMVHPNTFDPSPEVTLVLKQHDFFAYWTVYLSVITCIFGAASYFFAKKKGLEFGVMILMLLSLTSVSLTGHYGATLTHLQTVNVKNISQGH